MTARLASASAITVVGMSGMAFTCPDTSLVSPVKTHRPSSWALVTDGAGSAGSRTPANAHWVNHHANFR